MRPTSEASSRATRGDREVTKGAERCGCTLPPPPPPPSGTALPSPFLSAGCERHQDWTSLLRRASGEFRPVGLRKDCSLWVTVRSGTLATGVVFFYFKFPSFCFFSRWINFRQGDPYDFLGEIINHAGIFVGLHIQQLAWLGPVTPQVSLSKPILWGT